MYEKENPIHANKNESMPLVSFLMELLTEQYLSHRHGCSILHDEYFFLELKLRTLSSSEPTGDRSL